MRNKDNRNSLLYPTFPATYISLRVGVGLPPSLSRVMANMEAAGMFFILHKPAQSLSTPASTGFPSTIAQSWYCFPRAGCGSLFGKMYTSCDLVSQKTVAELASLPGTPGIDTFC